MSIIIVTGSPENVEFHTQALKSAQINKGSGALIVLMPDDGEHKIEHQIEKILIGDSFPEPPPTDLSQLNWKPNSMIIVSGDNASVLDQIELVLPGFKDFFGPISEIDIP